MEFKEFSTLCEQIFAINGGLPQLDEHKTQKLYLLTNHMLEVNKSLNLTAIKDEKAIILQHYADSLLICDVLEQGKTIIDVGCGAGFPTLPLAIFRPDLQILALDGTAKRIEYVKQTAKLLNLENVIAVAGRAEDFANDPAYREKYDYATARAVASLPILSELCLPFVKLGGSFVAMKAQKADEESAAAKTAIQKCGGRISKDIRIPLKNIDNAELMRAVIVADKISPTSKEFPRHYSKISKKPL